MLRSQIPRESTTDVIHIQFITFSMQSLFKNTLNFLMMNY